MENMSNNTFLFACGRVDVGYSFQVETRAWLPFLGPRLLWFPQEAFPIYCTAMTENGLSLLSLNNWLQGVLSQTLHIFRINHTRLIKIESLHYQQEMFCFGVKKSMFLS